ncbi:DUF1831 domain-containing protein [Ligilactobacillus apodemi]|uniref:Cysteine desulfurase n=1 Tax=Ligilactobacillus apodemi DSM 16634 = JCM 16172 TaxID=1423724 RepID=A0A0R1TZ78_9LACO|nr:DUF1831 domain-containing protein [Ligilactobacillus apodemi]KRL84136.1 hypothetical protein FC32_GL001416 [Ligilactobacillus apodemi DSM 16634 = JCM 16172]
MAYGKTAEILGDTTTYQLSSDVKKYALRDTGFMETKGGKFQLERSLDPASPFKGFKLKVVVAADLGSFKMVTTTANGLKEVNIFKGKDAAANQEQLEYILADLLARNIIEKV